MVDGKLFFTQQFHFSDIYKLVHIDYYFCAAEISNFLFLATTPRRFRAKVVGPNKLDVSWNKPKEGAVDSYKVIYVTRPGKLQCYFYISLHWLD